MTDNSQLQIVNVTTIVTFLGVLTYTTGWSYAYHWYSRFDLGLVSLSIPLEYYFIYGLWVFADYWWCAIILAASLLSYLVYCRKLLKLQILVVPIFALVCLMLFYYLASAVARLDYNQHKKTMFAEFPVVRVWIRVNGDTYENLEIVKKGLAEAKYRLLLLTSESVYLFIPTVSGELSILVIPYTEILALRKIPTNPGDFKANAGI